MGVSKTLAGQARRLHRIPRPVIVGLIRRASDTRREHRHEMVDGEMQGRLSSASVTIYLLTGSAAVSSISESSAGLDPKCGTIYIDHGMEHRRRGCAVRDHGTER